MVEIAVKCTTCNASGKIWPPNDPNPEDCPYCDGKGIVFISAQKLGAALNW